jgi:hypothetical protein
MAIDYSQLFVVVFMTHPGVIIPETVFGFSPIFGAIWQCFWVWALTKPAERSSAFGWTMFYLYIVFTMVYLYFVGGIRLTRGL